MSVAATMIADLRARGVTLEPRGGRLIAKPISRLIPGEQEALRQHKAEIMTLLERPPEPPGPLEVARILGLPIPKLDRMVEVRVPWLPVTLWFVPSATEVGTSSDALACPTAARLRPPPGGAAPAAEFDGPPANLPGRAESRRLPAGRTERCGVRGRSRQLSDLAPAFAKTILGTAR